MNYYDRLQHLAVVDAQDKITGKVEKWEAHRRGVLHRAFTLGLIYQGHYVLQHRKHPAFNGYLDLTISSHPLYRENGVQTDREAIYETLKREWFVQSADCVTDLKLLGKFYYRATDARSRLTEHEWNHVYTVELKSLPLPNYDYAYGHSLVSKEELYDRTHPIGQILTPWTIEALKLKMI